MSKMQRGYKHIDFKRQGIEEKPGLYKEIWHCIRKKDARRVGYIFYSKPLGGYAFDSNGVVLKGEELADVSELLKVLREENRNTRL